MQRCAIVVGAGGQDGHCVCRELTARGDRVVRIARKGAQHGIQKFCAHTAVAIMRCIQDGSIEIE